MRCQSLRCFYFILLIVGQSRSLERATLNTVHSSSVTTKCLGVAKFVPYCYRSVISLTRIRDQNNGKNLFVITEGFF